MVKPGKWVLDCNNGVRLWKFTEPENPYPEWLGLVWGFFVVAAFVMVALLDSR